MAFFSTAQRSPVAGQATAGLRDLMRIEESKRQFDVKNQAAVDKLIAEKNEEARMKSLSQSMLGLKTYDQENVTAWAISNNVSADELKALEPVMKQREQQEKWIDYETPDTSGQINLKTGKRTVKKKEPKVKWVDDEDEFTTFQRDPITGKKINIRKKSDDKPEVKWVNKESATETWQEHPISGKKINIRTKPQASAKKPGAIDKVADWYLKTKSEIEKAYYGDNLEPTDVQRQNFDRAMLRAETLITKTAQDLGISHEAAVPYAMTQIRKERVWANDVKNAVPDADRGFTNSVDETIQSVRQLRQQGIPDRIIGDALSEKGWNAVEVTDMMSTAANLVSAREAGLNPTTLKNTRIAEGQSIRDPKTGTIWVRQGKYLVSDDGRKVQL